MSRYFLRYRHSDTGLTPTFTFFKKASDLSVVTPPAVGEIGSGTYYFDYSPTFDIVFELDAGASIPTEEVRYISDTIGPKDTFIDSPMSQVKDDVWNEPAINHLAAGSFGQALQYEDSGLAQGGAATTVTLRAGASAVTDFYKNGLISITSGTGTEQSRSITAYDGATKIATVDRAWGTNPIAGDGYVVHPAAPSSSLTNVGIAGAVWDELASSHTTAGSFGQALQYEDSGLAQGGAATTVTLRAGASAINDFYLNGLVSITSGTGTEQSRSITAYNGTTKIATVDRAWGTNPIAGDGYVIHPAAPSSSLTNAGIAASVWDTVAAAHLTVGSTGAALVAGGSGGTPYVRFTSNGDTVLPIIVQVASPKHTQVRVTFSEPVVMTDAANGALKLANYSIPGLTLTDVVSLTAQQVMLTTSPQTPNFPYNLTVTGVEDLQGNPIA